MKHLSKKVAKRTTIVTNIITFIVCVAFSYFFGRASYVGFGDEMSTQAFWWMGFVTGMMACCAYWMLYLWICDGVKQWRNKRHDHKTNNMEVA